MKNPIKFKIDLKAFSITGALCALTILMGVPGLHLGYIQISAIASYTLLHIPVILAAILAGSLGGIGTAIVFGVTSLVNAAVNPSGVLDAFFVNPLCSVLPRLCFGVVAVLLHKLLSAFVKMIKCPVRFDIILTAILSTLAHTFFVIGSLYLFIGQKVVDAMGGVGFIACLVALLPNALVEASLAAIATMGVCVAMYGYSRATSKLAKEVKDDEADES